MVYTESEREEKGEGKQNDGEKDSQKFKKLKIGTAYKMMENFS